MKLRLLMIAGLLSISACGGLQKKAVLVNVGDSKAQISELMGTPDDRQVKDGNEAWQYCETAAGFGWHDYRTIWFRDGRVTGMNSYKSTRPASSCMADIRPVRWEDAPSAVVEIRNR